jgi:hypothetical protein
MFNNSNNNNNLSANSGIRETKDTRCLRQTEDWFRGLEPLRSTLCMIPMSVCLSFSLFIYLFFDHVLLSFYTSKKENNWAFNALV